MNPPPLPITAPIIVPPTMAHIETIMHPLLAEEDLEEVVLLELLLYTVVGRDCVVLTDPLAELFEELDLLT